MNLAERCEALIAQIAASRVLTIVSLLVVTVACVLPGFFAMPIMDGMEPDYVAGASAMVTTGDYATIRRQTGGSDLIWAARGGYWLPALAALMTDIGALTAMRAPSLLFSLAIPILVWWVALALMRPRAAFLAGIFMAASGVYGLQARLAMPDAALLFFFVLAAGALARLWLPGFSHGKTLPATLFWAALAGAFLIRGAVFPIAALISAGLLAVGNAEWTIRLRSPAGAIIIVFAIVFWLAVSLATWIWGSFDYLPDESLRRLGVTGILHAPPGTYLLLLPLLMGPAVTFLFVALTWLINNLWRRPVVFAVAWLLPAWLLAEYWPAKTPHIILPAMPPLALLAGLAVDRGGARIRGWISWFYSLGPFIWPPVTAVCIPVAYYYLEGAVPVAGTVFLVGAAILGPIAWFWLRDGYSVASAGMAVTSAMLIYWGFFGAMLPGLSGLRISERVVATASQTVACEIIEMSVTGYSEESMVFHSDGPVLFKTAADAAEFLNDAACRVAAVERGRISAFRQRADDLGLVLLDHGQIRGLNLRRVNRVEMHVFAPE